MKNILVFFLMLFAGAVMAQERTVTVTGSYPLDLNESKNFAINFTSTSDRLIPTTRDTIDYVIAIKNWYPGPLHFYCNITFDTIAGADTTVSISALYKQCNSETYSALTGPVTSDAVTGEVQKAITSLGVVSDFTQTATYAAFTIKQDTAGFKYYPADSLKVPAHTASITQLTTASLYYKYLKIRLIIKGNDSVGTGIKVKRLEINWF